MRDKRTLAILLAVISLCASAAGAQTQTPEPIGYTLRFPEPDSHYIEVEAVIPTENRASVELMMAVWTPGSYLVREFARNLEALSARTPAGGVDNDEVLDADDRELV